MRRVKFAALVLTGVAVLSLASTACSGAASTNTATPTPSACPPASGGVSGTHIGAIKVGVSRPEAEAEAKAAGMPADTRGTKYQEFFCEHFGVRVGYASPVLIAYAQHAGVPGSAGYADRVVWVSTSNPVYLVDGIQATDSITATSARLKRSGIVLTPHTVGANTWWIGGPWDGSSIVLKVGVVDGHRGW
jgi:hypothetical protein